MVNKYGDHMSLVHLRFNTESDGERDLWRLVIDGVEQLVDGVMIECPVETTTDWVESKQTFKHHVTARPDQVSFVTHDDGRVLALLG